MLFLRRNGEGLLSVAHSTAEYMRDFRRRQSEKDAQKEADFAWLKADYDVMRDEFIRHYLAQGHTMEQAEGYLKEYTASREMWGRQDLESVGVASDSVPEMKRDCFGTHEPEKDCDCSWHEDCHRAWMVKQKMEADKKAIPLQQCIILRVKKDNETVEVARAKCEKIFSDSSYSQMDSQNPDQLELMVTDWTKREMMERQKPQRVKDAERTARIATVIDDNKALLRKSELQELIRIGATMQAQKDAEEKQLGALTQKYTDRGIPEKTARKSAEWELKQMQNAETARKMEAQDKWDLMPPDKRKEFKKKLWRENKKFLEGST